MALAMLKTPTPYTFPLHRPFRKLTKRLFRFSKECFASSPVISHSSPTFFHALITDSLSLWLFLLLSCHRGKDISSLIQLKILLWRTYQNLILSLYIYIYQNYVSITSLKSQYNISFHFHVRHYINM